MSLHWFACYPNDLLGSLRWRSMTPEQRGAYWQLICLQMQSEDGTLPDDTTLLGRLAELDLAGVNRCVLDAFPIMDEGRRANPRAYSEWLKRVDLSQKRSKAGAIGMANRWQIDNNCNNNCNQGDKNLLPTITITSTSTETPKKTTSTGASAPATRKRAADRDDSGFALFWESYPRKTAKANAAKAWSKLNPDTALTTRIMQALAGQTTGVWAGRTVEYIPHAATWLNGRRWEDEASSAPVHQVQAGNGSTPPVRHRTQYEEDMEIMAWQAGKAPRPEWYRG